MSNSCTSQFSGNFEQIIQEVVSRNTPIPIEGSRSHVYKLEHCASSTMISMHVTLLSSLSRFYRHRGNTTGEKKSLQHGLDTQL